MHLLGFAYKQALREASVLLRKQRVTNICSIHGAMQTALHKNSLLIYLFIIKNAICYMSKRGIFHKTNHVFIFTVPKIRARNYSPPNL